MFSGVPNTPDGQHHFTFVPPAAGIYRLRVVVPPTSSVVIDIGHSTKPEG